MIKNKWVWLVLFLVFSLALFGCQQTAPEPTASVPTGSTPTGSSAPARSSQEETEVPTQTSAPTNLPMPTHTPVITAIPLVEQLNCGESFCQAAWPSALVRPISGEYRDTIDPTYPYASTKGGTLDVHYGVEFPNAFGTPVRAVADGLVVFAGQDDLTLLGPYTGFYGNVVILRHPNFFQERDLFSLYAHLSELDVKEGDQLKAGDTLGKVGASGAADGSHLHFEIRIDENNYRNTVNPVLWFSPTLNQNGSQLATLAGRILDPTGEPLSEFDFVLEQQEKDVNEAERFYPVTYVPYGVNAHPLLGENFTLSDIPPGEYRLAFVAGRLYEFTVTIDPGSLGFIEIQLD